MNNSLVLKKILQSTMIFIGVYFATIVISYFVIFLLQITKANLNIAILSILLATLFSTVPHLVLLRFISRFNYTKPSFIAMSIINILLEKLLWLVLGYCLYVTSPDGLFINEDFLLFIKREVFPFYQWYYTIIGLLISMCIYIRAYIVNYR